MINPIAMFPVLVAENLLKLKEFYETEFGFRTDFFQEDFYLHLQQPDSGIQLAFMVPDHPSQPDFLQSSAACTGMVISLEVAEAKLAFDEATKAGLDIFFKLKTEEFGVTHFMVRDPAGFAIDIVEHHV